jgi:hypothetical protein
LDKFFLEGDYTRQHPLWQTFALKIDDKTYQSNGLFFNFVAQINRNIKFL